MSEISEYIDMIEPLLFNQLFSELKKYISENLKFPGAQGNLSLCVAFVSCFSKKELAESAYSILLEWKDIECNTNEPMLTLPFCAIRAHGFHILSIKILSLRMISAKV